VGGPDGKKRTDAADAADAARRRDGIARLFYPGRHARRAAFPAPPGDEVYRLVGQLVDPADVVFFDWSPSDSHEPAGPTGEIVLMTTRTLTHVTYQAVRHAAGHHAAGNAAGDAAGNAAGDASATDIAVHRLKRVRSLHWSAGDPARSSANERRRGIVIVGDDWEVTVSAAGSVDHVPYLTRLFKLA
jgi:hypothetical protein